MQAKSLAELESSDTIVTEAANPLAAAAASGVFGISNGVGKASVDGSRHSFGSRSSSNVVCRSNVIGTNRWGQKASKVFGSTRIFCTHSFYIRVKECGRAVTLRRSPNIDKASVGTFYIFDIQL
eukprot:scaffold333264_cov56-Attheya_sp.AAC.2